MNTAALSPGRVPARLLLPLAVLAALAPFATDLYLPAFPAMVDELGTTEAGVQLSLTAFLLGAGAGQLIFGPLSDRLGRRGPLVAGLVLSVLSSIAAALAPSIALLIAARLLQGMAASAGMVIGRAMISDLAWGREAARAMSMMMVVGGVAPVLAPILGALLSEPIGWRGLLWLVAALCVIALTLALVFLRETHGQERRMEARRERAAEAAASGGRVRIGLLDRGYLGNTFAFAFAFATMMAYISASPFLYQELMGFDALGYGYSFAANALLLVLGTALSARLAGRVAVRKIAGAGLTGSFVAVACIAILSLSGAPTVWLFVPVMIAVGSLGLVFGNTTALALSALRGSAGTGSAVIGLLQFLLAGAVAPLVGLGDGTSAVPLALTMLATIVIAVVAFRIGAPRRDAGRRDAGRIAAAAGAAPQDEAADAPALSPAAPSVSAPTPSTSDA